VPGTPYKPNIQPRSAAATADDSRPSKTRSELITLLQRLTVDVERLVKGGSFSGIRPKASKPSEMPRYHFHFMAKTLMEDHEGRPFPDAEDALRHAKVMAAQFLKSGILFGCSILIVKDDEVLFEVPVSRGMN
jgi:hypothetical protein